MGIIGRLLWGVRLFVGCVGEEGFCAYVSVTVCRGLGCVHVGRDHVSECVALYPMLSASLIYFIRGGYQDLN